MQLERHDIQGILVRAYSHLPEARFILLQFGDGAAAKTWLASLADQLTNSERAPRKQAVNIALASPGVRKLNLDSSALASFSREWLEGMHDSVRANHLGDENLNAPDTWKWGGPNTAPVDAMLMCYAKDDYTLGKLCEDQLAAATAAGITAIADLDSETLIKQKEHFGFHDGVSQPVMESLARQANKNKPYVVKDGEFVLGYRNAYHRYSESPAVPPALDPNRLLPRHPDKPGMGDLGKNGSYLVYRQMTQDVHAFWKYLHDHSKEEGADKTEAAIKLGAKMVGRWPGGAPLVTSPEVDDPKQAKANDFGYWDDDPDGSKCPFGSHIRRTNPRDWLFTERQQDVSAEMVAKHRILRRGRSFGAPLAPSMRPEDILAAGDDGKERGLHFICMVGTLNRQFEFLQNAWVKTPTFAGLYRDADPLIAARQGPGEQLTDEFTCPAAPLRRKYKGMPQFTRVVGGAYFFLPGINALKYLATC